MKPSKKEVVYAPTFMFKNRCKESVSRDFWVLFDMYGLVQVCIRTSDSFIFSIIPTTLYLNVKLDAVNAKSTQLNNVKPRFFVNP